jgi:hypothetical protein
MDLFSHGSVVRFFLRRGVLLVPLVVPRALFVGGDPAAASVGATMAL